MMQDKNTQDKNKQGCKIKINNCKKIKKNNNIKDN